MTRSAEIAQAKLLAGPLARFLPRMAEDLHYSESLHLHDLTSEVDDCGYCWLRAARCLRTLGLIEPEHVLDIRDSGWTLRHPLLCRESDLFGCHLGLAVEAQMADGAPDERGQFIVTLSKEGFAVLGDPAAHVSEAARP